MKSTFALCAFILAFPLLSCQKSNDGDNTPATLGPKIEGKWRWVKSVIQLKFDDGTEQNVTANGDPGDYIELDYTNRLADGTGDNGKIITVALGTTTNGVWQLYDKDNRLEILYQDPLGFVYRKVETVDNNKLILTADSQTVVEQYTDNGLHEIGDKKLIGGSIYEEYSKF
jgi:hypothetical protein